MHGSPGSDQVVMFGEAVATPVPDSSLSSLTDTSMSNPISVRRGQGARTSVEYQQATIGQVEDRQIVFGSHELFHFTDARSISLLGLNPLVVAEARQIVSDVQGQAIQC